MIKKILKTIILVGPTILPTGLLLTDSPLAKSGFISLILGIYFILSIWRQDIILKIPSFLRGILLLLSFPLWFGFFGMSFIALISILPEDKGVAYGFHCTACDDGQINPIVSDNNVELDLSKGKELKKYDGDAWQSCGCRKVVSFEENSDYAIEQISLMDNYWTEYKDCQIFLKPYATYAQEVDFNADGSCYAHVQTLDKEWKYTEIVIVYDKKTNRLFYHFNRS